MLAIALSPPLVAPAPATLHSTMDLSELLTNLNISIPLDVSLPLNLSFPADLSLPLDALAGLRNPLAASEDPQEWMVGGVTLGVAAMLLQLLAGIAVDSVKVIDWESLSLVSSSAFRTQLASNLQITEQTLKIMRTYRKEYRNISETREEKGPSSKTRLI